MDKAVDTQTNTLASQAVDDFERIALYRILSLLSELPEHSNLVDSLIKEWETKYIKICTEQISLLSNYPQDVVDEFKDVCDKSHTIALNQIKQSVGKFD